ncbi:MAG: hypothetical protein CFH01_00143 [Alphaproteobacteria bacterium MarineAlpha2_Bin1]|nr:MAG: hypothetical protein CFH01_00143 [Alphaproteobacteria bacterium MarineAlpha2_Bin1]|tara:strand:- start:805 stop:1053 length:249 start_codon:yes stop_codon:yes gene_type:complete
MTNKQSSSTIFLSEAQKRYLERGLGQPGGKLPIFNEDGSKISDKTIKSCIEKGYAKPWFKNPVKPDWLICKLTDRGRDILKV